MLALTASAWVNLINSKLSYVFLGKNKASWKPKKPYMTEFTEWPSAVFAWSIAQQEHLYGIVSFKTYHKI